MVFQTRHTVSFLVSIGAVAGIVGSAKSAMADPVQWPQNGHYYEFVSAPGLSWSQARQAAEARSFAGRVGRLVSIEDADENNFVSGLTSQGSNRSAWIGLYYIAPNWVWTNGNALGTYQNWINGEPSGGQVVEMTLSTPPGVGLWNAAGDVAGGQVGYFVEYDQPCITVVQPTPGQTAPRGCRLRIRWLGPCLSTPQWQFGILRNGQLEPIFPQAVDEGNGAWHADWLVPSAFAEGCTYYVRITDANTGVNRDTPLFCVATGLRGDLDGDGDVDLVDLAMLLSDFGRSCGQ